MHFLNQSLAVTRHWLKQHHFSTLPPRHFCFWPHKQQDDSDDLVQLAWFTAEPEFDGLIQAQVGTNHTIADRLTLSRSRAYPHPEPTAAALQSVDQPADGEPTVPNMPLRDRDVKMMTEFFEHQHIQEIEADITQNLRLRWPEPCWDAEPYTSLRDYC